jgi:hypothetical protein
MSRARSGLVVATVIAGVVLFSAPLLGGFSHVLFRTDKVEATVVALAPGGRCLAGTEYHYAFSWDRGGERHTGEDDLCGMRFQVFEHTAIWVDGDEVASTESPWKAWGLWLVGALLVAGAARLVRSRVS